MRRATATAVSIVLVLLAVVALGVVAVPAPSHAATLYAANNGVDDPICGVPILGATCGAKTSPCRSIQCVLAVANPGDTIIVGPGRYGDLNFDGDLDDEGEEFGSPGCGCMLSVNKAVTLVSSHGAAATMIDARTLELGTNVLLILDGGEFGRPGKGFMVTGTNANPLAAGFGHAITVDSNGVKIRGNQMVFPSPPGAGTTAAAITTVDGPGTVLIEGNQVLGGWEGHLELGGWDYGIEIRGSNKTVRKNHVSVRLIGILSRNGSPTIVGNRSTGIFIDDSPGAVVTGNAAYGNDTGIDVSLSSDGGPFKIEGNNVFGNRGCGIHIGGSSGGSATATNNYWGASTGPGGDPADEFCNDTGAAITTAPFATKPFNIDPPLRP
jgi:parallel beta-helix repeat protein